MAQKQISARLQGDDYQARFFWYQAAYLLIPDSRVERVKLENDDAPYIDDVTVFHAAPGRRDSGVNCLADYYQVKFHVNQANAYCAEGLMDPSFIGSTKKSLLQRFFGTYSTLRGAYPDFTLGLVSNWTWKSDDKLALAIRHSGALPDAFFEARTRSKLGQLRQRWQEHVGADEAMFRDFASRLRLKLNYFGYSDLNAALNDRLQRAGLIPIDPAQAASPYDELARKFIVEGETDFNAHNLLRVCEREGLLASHIPNARPRRIGFRTFVPFAELIESETDAFVCGADLFDGRHPRTKSSWSELYARFDAFAQAQRPTLTTEHQVLLDCHTSAALAAGYLLTTRAAVWPVGPRPILSPCKPSEPPATPEGSLWTLSTTPLGEGLDVAIAISVTHRVQSDVLRFLLGRGDQIGKLLEFIPTGGHGAQSVHNADHALGLVDELLTRIRELVGEAPVKHVFMAGPNFLTFFLGQRLRPLGQVVVYEYDFDGPEPREYHPALRLPFRPVEAQGVPNDSER